MVPTVLGPTLEYSPTVSPLTDEVLRDFYSTNNPRDSLTEGDLETLLGQLSNLPKDPTGKMSSGIDGTRP